MYVYVSSRKDSQICFGYDDYLSRLMDTSVLYLLVMFNQILYILQMIVMFFEASEVTCSLKIWFRELGFSISYGALLLKTWRISMVFRVRSATQIKITDSGLIRRLGIVVAVFVVFLIARMIWGRPRVITGKLTGCICACYVHKKRHCAESFMQCDPQINTSCIMYMYINRMSAIRSSYDWSQNTDVRQCKERKYGQIYNRNNCYKDADIEYFKYYCN